MRTCGSQLRIATRVVAGPTHELRVVDSVRVLATEQLRRIGQSCLPLLLSLSRNDNIFYGIRTMALILIGGTKL